MLDVNMSDLQNPEVIKGRVEIYREGPTSTLALNVEFDKINGWNRYVLRSIPHDETKPTRQLALFYIDHKGGRFR